MEHTKDIQIGKKWIGNTHPSYFIADIAANHDGDLLSAAGLCCIDWINRSADFSIYLGWQGLYIY